KCQERCRLHYFLYGNQRRSIFRNVIVWIYRRKSWLALGLRISRSIYVLRNVTILFWSKSIWYQWRESEKYAGIPRQENSQPRRRTRRRNTFQRGQRPFNCCSRADVGKYRFLPGF